MTDLETQTAVVITLNARDEVMRTALARTVVRRAPFVGLS